MVDCSQSHCMIFFGSFFVEWMWLINQAIKTSRDFVSCFYVSVVNIQYCCTYFHEKFIGTNIVSDKKFAFPYAIARSKSIQPLVDLCHEILIFKCQILYDKSSVPVKCVSREH